MRFSSKILSMTFLSATIFSTSLDTLYACSSFDQEPLMASTTKKPHEEQYDWNFLATSSQLPSKTTRSLEQSSSYTQETEQRQREEREKRRQPDGSILISLDDLMAATDRNHKAHEEAEVMSSYKKKFPYLSEQTIKGLLLISSEEIEAYETDFSNVLPIKMRALLDQQKINQASLMAAVALALGHSGPAVEMGKYFLDTDIEKATFWLNKAHKKGSPSATAILAAIHLQNNNLIEAERLALLALKAYEHSSFKVLNLLLRKEYRNFSQNCLRLNEEMLANPNAEKRLSTLSLPSSEKENPDELRRLLKENYRKLSATFCCLDLMIKNERNALIKAFSQQRSEIATYVCLGKIKREEEKLIKCRISERLLKYFPPDFFYN